MLTIWSGLYPKYGTTIVKQPSSEESPRQANPTIGDEFAIEQEAVTILRDSLPSKWVIRPHNPDFHLDYLVEISEEGELTGVNFGVQLKGHRPKTGSVESLKYSLKMKHLKYYVKKCQCSAPRESSGDLQSLWG